jgi:hypothetical protein
MGALVPIAGGAMRAAGAARAFRVIEGGAGAAAGAAAAAAGTAAGGGLIGAAAAIGGVVGPGAALAGAFAFGFEFGKQLLAAWEILNGLGLPGTPFGDPYDPDGWPEPNPGQTIVIQWRAEQKWPSDPSWEGLIEFTTGGGKPSITEVVVNAFGPGLDGVYWRPEPSAPVRGMNKPLRFSVLSYSTSDGQPPKIPLQGGSTAPGLPDALDRLRRAADSAGVPLPAPLAFVPPAQPVIPSAPSRAPVVTPAPVIAPAPAPRPSVPAGRPGPSPAPGSLPAITPGPGRAPAQWPQPSTFPQIDPLRPPVPIGPTGVPVAPRRSGVQVTPPDIVTEGGIQIGDAAARPRPDLDAIARELGRQEQKLAGLLGGLGYPEAFDSLLELLTSINGGTTYSLHPPCGTDANGDPLLPVEVIVPPSIGDSAAIINRLDALAMLLDEHKAMRQPICKGKPTGRPVTVTFAEVDP